MDADFVEKIVQEVKSQGLFDEFRKDSLGEVDTKPAYQNLHSRVENAVKNFLAKQKWTPETNKIQLREKLRKHIAIDLGFLDAGVERIVDQVVNPKIATVFQPKIEQIAYTYLGITPPEPMPGAPPLPPDPSILAPPPSLPPLSHLNGSMLSVETISSLLPTDLEQISPDSDRATMKSDSKHGDDELPPGVDAVEDPCDDDISPPFEPIVKQDIVKPVSITNTDAVQEDSLESLHTTHSVKEDISASFFAGASQQSQLSQVSSDSRLTAMSSISAADADQSKNLTPNAAVNISEEAQMPNFNDNSCEASNVKNGEDLHFDIKKDAIKFEGTERRSSLSEVVNGTNVGVSKNEIESAIMAEVEKNLAEDKSEIITNDEKQDTQPTQIAPDSSFGSCGGDTPSSTTPQKPTENIEQQPDKDKPDKSISAKDTVPSTSSVVELTTKPPPPPSQKQEQPGSAKDGIKVKQPSSSSSRHKKHSKDKRHHSDDKNKSHSGTKDRDRSRDKTQSSSHKHSTSSSKHSSSSSRHSSHKSSSSRRDKNQSNHSSSASSSRSSTTHDSNSKRSERRDGDRKYKTSSSSSMSKSEKKERSSSSSTKKSERDRNKSSSTTHDDHNESKTKKPRRKSNDSNDEGKALNGKTTTTLTQKATDSATSSPPIDKSKSNNITETNGNRNGGTRTDAHIIIQSNDFNANVNQVIILNDILEHSSTDYVELTETGGQVIKTIVANDDDAQNPTPTPTTKQFILEQVIKDLSSQSSPFSALKRRTTTEVSIKTNKKSTKKSQNRSRSEPSDQSPTTTVVSDEEKEFHFLKKSDFDFTSRLNDLEQVIVGYSSAKNYYKGNKKAAAAAVNHADGNVEEVKKVSRCVSRNKRRPTSALQIECNTQSSGGDSNLSNTTQRNPNADADVTIENVNDDIEDDEQTQQQSKRLKRDTKPSPPLSDASSVNSKENEALEKNVANSGSTGNNHIRSKLSRTSVNKLFQQQRYTNDDLYKPRPVLSQRSRRRHLDSIP